jgi:dipeptidyl aminopeptidase/acylaminoacyl peptidase
MAERAPVAARLDADALASVVVREDARISPDGSRVMAVSHRPRRDGSREPQVVLVEGVASRPRARVLRRRAWLPRWSPDGSCAAMVRAGRGGLHVAVHRLGQAGAADGAGAVDLPPAFGSVAEVAWAPDGTRLAVVGTGPGGDRGAGDAVGPSVAVVDVGTGEARRHAVDGEAAGVAWSPDGSRLAVRVRDPGGYVAWLAVLDAATGARLATAGGPGSRILAATWTPDGAGLVVLGAPAFSFHPGLHRCDPGTGRLAAILDDPAPFVADLGGWLGADRLLVHGRERARSGLYVLDTGAGRLDRVADLEGRAWGLTVDAAGRRFATVRETAAQPPVLVVGEVAAGAWTALPDRSRSLAGLGPASRPERIEVPSDDVVLDAWVLPARGAGITAPAPAVLMVHGGPHDDLGDEWDVGVGQLLAQEGYVVAWTNPRGSTSYGRRFADAVAGDLGGAELRDLVAVTDAVAARPDVDRARIGICGYSHGGFLAASAVTRTDRFAAGVCWAPVTDLLSEWGMSDEGRGWGRFVVGRDPVRETDAYRAASPASHVTPDSAPTLLVHGDRDERCPIGQSELFHALLAEAGVPTRLVRVPGADHDLFATPRSLALVARETLAWFDAHLGPAAAAAP